MHSRTAPLGDTANSRFGDTVGEPRGIGTQPSFRVQDWLYTVISIKAGLDGRLTGFLTEFSTRFTEFGTRFTEFSTRFTEFGTRLTSELTSFDLRIDLQKPSHMPHSLVRLRTVFQS